MARHQGSRLAGSVGHSTPLTYALYTVYHAPMGTQKRRIVYFTDEEWADAKERAALHEMTVSAYIRASVIGGSVIPKSIEKQMGAALMPDRTGMVFAAAKRENKADVGPERPSVANGLPPSSLVSPSYDSVRSQVEYRPVPKPARKK